MNSALLFVALVGVVCGQTTPPERSSDQTSIEVVKKWSQDIVSALNAEPILHSELLLRIDDDTKIIYPDDTAPMGGRFTGISGYWNFVERILHSFSLTDKNFSLLKVEPAFFRSLVSANFKIKSLPFEGQQQQSRNSNWTGKIILQFCASGKLTHLIFIDENFQQTMTDLKPKGVQMLNDLSWAYFKSQSPLTLQSDVWQLVDDNVKVTFKNVPRQLFNDSVVTGKQALFDRMQALERLCHHESQSNDVRSFMDLLFHYKFDVKSLIADDMSVLSKVLWGRKTKFLTLHTFDNQKLKSIDITLLKLLQPWDVLPLPTSSPSSPIRIGRGVVNATCGQYC